MKTRHRFSTTYWDILLPVSSAELQGQQISDSTSNPSYLLITLNKTLAINVQIKGRLIFYHKNLFNLSRERLDFFYCFVVFNTANTHTFFPPNPFWLWSWKWCPNIELDEVRYVKCPKKCHIEESTLQMLFFSFMSQLPHDQENCHLHHRNDFYFSKRVQKYLKSSLTRIHVSEFQSARCSIKTKQKYPLTGAW